MPEQTILIVDESAETREVLRTVLARSGRQIYATPRAADGVELARRYRPQLIVLDVEAYGPADEEVIGQFGRSAETGETRLVLLATAKRQVARLPHGEFVAKPYHYGPLIRKIEDLLGGSA